MPKTLQAEPANVKSAVKPATLRMTLLALYPGQLAKGSLPLVYCRSSNSAAGAAKAKAEKTGTAHSMPPSGVEIILKMMEWRLGGPFHMKDRRKADGKPCRDEEDLILRDTEAL